jgi:hypothetical protein
MVLSVLSKSCPRGRCATQKEWSEEQEWGEDGVHCLFIGTLIPLVIGVFPPGYKNKSETNSCRLIFIQVPYIYSTTAYDGTYVTSLHTFKHLKNIGNL